MVRFVNKSFKKRLPQFSPIIVEKPAEEIRTEDKKEEEIKEETVEKPKSTAKKNKKVKKDAEMNTNEQKIATAELIAGRMEPEVKVVKKDRGLIERTESSKIILTEDNRQVLND